MAFRVGFGIVMFWEVCRFFQYGWIDSYYRGQDLYFTYDGFGWVRPWPGLGMHLHFLVLGGLALCVMAGLWYRLSIVLFCAGWTYVFLLEQAQYLNHLYLVCLISFLMIFVPAHRTFSLDARRRPAVRSDTAPTWALALLAFQIGVPYVYGGIAKLNPDWLRGEPMRMWMANETDFPVLGRWFTSEWMVYAASYGGLLFDLVIVPLVLWPRTRWLALIALVLFHRFNAEMFSIGIFPMLATLAAVVFLPPEWPRRCAQRLGALVPARWRLRGSRPTSIDPPIAPARWSLPSPWQRVTIALVVTYVAVQVLIPVRHWLYPGDTAWTEQGHRFSWRMKLNNKVGDIAFTVYDPQSRQSWEVDPADHITRRQSSKMTVEPDMILQFSHFLADEWRRDGYDGVEVRARSSVSLNGRDLYPLVDPTVDLAAEERSIWPADWITNLGDLEDESRND